METQNKLLQYKRRTPALSDGFYHPECEQLYAQHDTITSLADCPFPLATDSFKVLLFGTSKSLPDDNPKYGHTKRFAVVEYVKTCGHLSHERISFQEGVETFNHYGTIFEGESYSINDWKRRIEYFRNRPCDVCGMVNHALFIYRDGLAETVKARSLKNSMERCLFLLDANYSNWREFVSEDQIEAKFNEAKKQRRAS